MRWLSLIVGFVFLVAGIKAIFVYDPNINSISRPLLLLTSFGCSALFAFLFLKATKNNAQISDFETWLNANETKILTTGAAYNGLRITGNTELTKFLLTTSIIFLTFKIPSRYYVAGKDNVTFTKISYSVASLLFGWWGIPWGPIYTVQALAKNMSGGYKISVQQYFFQSQ